MTQAGAGDLGKICEAEHLRQKLSAGEGIHSRKPHFQGENGACCVSRSILPAKEFLKKTVSTTCTLGKCDLHFG